MKTKSLAFLMMGFFMLAVIRPAAQNVLYDGDFSNTTDIMIYPYDPPPMNIWCAYQNTGTEAYPVVTDQVCCYQVVYGGTESWEVQLTQYGFILESGHSYRLSFDVKADTERSFGVFLGEFWGNWTNLLGWERYVQYATTTWQTITMDLDVSCIFAINKISFELGGAGINTYFDNILLTDLGPYAPIIGIVGTSLMGWDTDIDMQTTDNVIYTLTDYPMVSGYVKFRQDHLWCINWGDISFPTGNGYQDGPNIPVCNAGNYDITFNRLTGEYSFSCVNNCSPYIGIIGTAVPPGFGMEPDQDLFTNDGLTYELHGYYFVEGSAKFRQDNNWDMNWGNADFPSGTGILNGTGNEIPIPEGVYNVTFNRITADYNFGFLDIGILGSALTGWDNDIDMVTSDGINYTLPEYSFNEGYVKFREGNSWDVNWGGYGFPQGYAWTYGPDIPVMAGTYTVNFNILSGEYLFTATSCPVPALQCSWGEYWGTDWGLCGATVFYQPVSPAPNCGGPGVVISQTAGLPPGSFFPLGSTTNTYILTNAEGNTATCSFDITVYDSEPPAIVGIGDYLDPLWPPNHQMVLVPLNYTTQDNCGGTTEEIYIWSNEPESGTGPGDLSPDWEIADTHTIWLRAERAGKGTGREYTILILSQDENYNYSYHQVIVPVPHDMRVAKDKVVVQDNSAGTSVDNFGVTIWPNPAHLEFTIEVSSSSDLPVEYTLSDLTGRAVYTSSSGNLEPIKLGQQLQPGIYLIRVTQGLSVKTCKLIKQ